MILDEEKDNRGERINKRMWDKQENSEALIAAYKIKKYLEHIKLFVVVRGVR